MRRKATKDGSNSLCTDATLLMRFCITTSFSYEDYPQTLAKFQACNAFLEPNEGKLINPAGNAGL